MNEERTQCLGKIIPQIKAVFRKHLKLVCTSVIKLVKIKGLRLDSIIRITTHNWRQYRQVDLSTS